jgi:hypothetical protein
MRRIVTGLIISTIVPSIAAEKRLNLDTPATGQFRIADPRLLHPCDLGAVVAQIGHALTVPVGFENTRDCGLTLRGYPDSNSQGTEDLRGMSVRQAFDYLMTFMPAFSWREMNRVIVVRPKVEWDDPRNVLNFPTAAFAVTDQPLNDVLRTLLEAVTPTAFVTPVHLIDPEAPINRRVIMSFRGGTMVDALNAVARTRTGLDWQLAYRSGPGRATIAFGALGVRGGSLIQAPVAVPEVAP